MSEQITKATKIVVTIETNKQSHVYETTQHPEEGIDDTLKRVEEWVVEMYEELA